MGETKRSDAISGRGKPPSVLLGREKLKVFTDSKQYGGNILKAHIGRWSEDCPGHQGVVVLGMDDMPLVRSFRFPFRFYPIKHTMKQTYIHIFSPDEYPSNPQSHPQGFGVTARSTAEGRKLEPTAIICFRQADVGEYLREVSQLLPSSIQRPREKEDSD